MVLASAFKLDELVGKKVKALREFAMVPVGTTGTVSSTYNIGSRHRGINVEWDVLISSWSTRRLTDGFGRDQDLDETQWLEVI